MLSCSAVPCYHAVPCHAVLALRASVGVQGFQSVYKPKRSGTVSFAELLDAVASVDPEMRIRFTSPHPKEFSDEVLQVSPELSPGSSFKGEALLLCKHGASVDLTGMLETDSSGKTELALHMPSSL